MLAPIIGDIPGVPTLMAIIVLLVAGHLLIGRHQLWLLERPVARGKGGKAVLWMRARRGLSIASCGCAFPYSSMAPACTPLPSYASS